MGNIKSKIAGSVLVGSLFLFAAVPAFAHAVVRPSTAGIGSFTDFSLGVPSEKPVATTSVKLMIPAGLSFVSPIVKSGWKIDVKQSPDPSGKKDDDGNPAMIVSELDWTGGSIPSGQKDFFMFSAQVPAKEGELDWKVEQTYADGSAISWNVPAPDQQPKDAKGNSDFSKSGPYSKTMVVNDLKASTSPQAASTQTKTAENSDMIDSSEKGPWILSGIALLVSIVALGMQFMKKSSPGVS